MTDASPLSSVERADQLLKGIEPEAEARLRDIWRGYGVHGDYPTMLHALGAAYALAEESNAFLVRSLREELREARANNARSVCVWCGTITAFPNGPETTDADRVRVMWEHAEGCDKRPERRLADALDAEKSQREALEARVKALTEALTLIQGERCSRRTTGLGSCTKQREWTPDAEYTADRWCNACIAWAALTSASSLEAKSGGDR